MKPIRPNKKSFEKSWIIPKTPRPTPALLLSLSFALSPSFPLFRFLGNARHTCVLPYENTPPSPPCLAAHPFASVTDNE